MRLTMKPFLVLVMFGGLTVFIHAGEKFSSANLYLRWAEHAIINDDFLHIGSAGEFRFLMDQLDLSSRTALYEKYRKNPWVGIVFNAILPGFGSMAIGDTGSALVIWGSLGLSIPTLYGIFYVGIGNINGNPALGAISTALVLLWIGEIGFAYGYGLFSPGPYVDNWNLQLKRSLMIAGEGLSGPVDCGTGLSVCKNIVQIDLIKAKF